MSNTFTVKAPNAEGVNEEVEVTLADLAGIDTDAIEAKASGFDVTQKGAYSFAIANASLEEVGEWAVVKFECEITDCLATAGDKVAEQMVGEMHEEMIFISDAIKAVAEAKFFMAAAGFAGTGSFDNMLDGFVGTRFTGKVAHSSPKNDPDKVYANLDMKSVKPAVAA